MPRKARRGELFARSLASAQIAWALCGTAWMLTYAVAAGAFSPLAEALPYRGAHFGHAMGLMLLLALLLSSPAQRGAAVRGLFCAMLVYAAPLLLWQLTADTLILAAPDPVGAETALSSANFWGPPVAFLAAGIGALLAYAARASLRRAVLAAAAPALFCLVLGTAILGAAVAGAGTQQHEAGSVFVSPRDR
jgi:hypothetical protein